MKSESEGSRIPIRPKRYYEELAEVGALEDFLKGRLTRDLESNPQFREDMTEILYRLSPKPSPTVEKLYLEKLIETLGYFLEYVRPWTNQKR